MGRLAKEGSNQLPIRQLATGIVQEVEGKDFEQEACACLQWVKDNIRYVKDIKGTETLHTADTILKQRHGDCDDMAILLGAMLLSIGHDIRFICVSFQADNWSHVWTQSKLLDNDLTPYWLDLEPTVDVPCGTSIPLRMGSKLLWYEV